MNLQKLFFASAVLAAMSGPAYSRYSPTELENCWVDVVGNPTGFEFDYGGNVTSAIPPQTGTDPTLDPFYAMHLLSSTFNSNPVTVTYDSIANLTRVTQSGSALPNPPPNNLQNPNQTGNSYHMGINVGPQSGSSGPLVSREWLYTNTTFLLPTLQVSWNGVFSGKAKGLFWAAIYIQPSGSTVGCWSYTGYQTVQGQKTEFEIANHSAAPVVIDMIGYQLGFPVPDNRKCRQSPQCKENQKALDELNGKMFPPPGFEGSTFTTVKPPKKALQPGDTFVFNAK